MPSGYCLGRHSSKPWGRARHHGSKKGKRSLMSLESVICFLIAAIINYQNVVASRNTALLSYNSGRQKLNTYLFHWAKTMVSQGCIPSGGSREESFLHSLAHSPLPLSSQLALSTHHLPSYRDAVITLGPHR